MKAKDSIQFQSQISMSIIYIESIYDAVKIIQTDSLDSEFKASAGLCIPFASKKQDIRFNTSLVLNLHHVVLFFRNSTGKRQLLPVSFSYLSG